jgi:ankyrin repeat protein
MFYRCKIPSLRRPPETVYDFHDEIYDRAIESVLYHCSRHSLSLCVPRLLDLGGNPNEWSSTTFRYPLLAAVSPIPPRLERTESTVKELLQKGADVSLVNEWKQTALHIAAARSTVEIIWLLLEKGADPKALDVDGETPVQRAKLQHNSKIEEAFVEKGAMQSAEDACEKDVCEEEGKISVALYEREVGRIERDASEKDETLD